jgi:hypothetical protein
MRAPVRSAVSASLLASSLAAAAAILVVVGAPAPAFAAGNPAGDPAAVAKVTNLNKKAIDAYNKQDYDTARQLLKEALQTAADANLDTHPITARTHIHFGIVAIVGYKQREVGIKQFRKALEIQPDIKLTKSLITPELQDAFEEAVLAAGDQGGGGGGAATAQQGGDQQQSDDNKQAAAEGGEESAAPSGGQGEEGDEDATPRKRPKVTARKKHKEEEGEGDEGGGGGFFLSLQVGSGVGLSSGNGELDPINHKLSSPGFAAAQAGQIAPEVGYFLNKDMLLSLQLRYQFVTGVNGEAQPPGTTGCGSDGFCTPGKSALAVFAKATWLFGDGGLHWTIGGQIGGGNIRHAVSFNNNNCAAAAGGPYNQSCVDTLAGGPFLIGPTAGIMWDLGSSVDLIVALNTALGVPKFTFNLDFNLGIGFRL